jgi:hypothetical protein
VLEAGSGCVPSKSWWQSSDVPDLPSCVTGPVHQSTRSDCSSTLLLPDGRIVEGVAPDGRVVHTTEPGFNDCRLGAGSILCPACASVLMDDPSLDSGADARDAGAGDAN